MGIPECLLRRARSEFLEMPGMSLTTMQAARLWNLDLRTCERVLEHLASSGFLVQGPSGRYLASRWSTRG
jgi:DNA-binding IclR family transcriptional regulator